MEVVDVAAVLALKPIQQGASTSRRGNRPILINVPKSPRNVSTAPKLVFLYQKDCTRWYLSLILALRRWF